MLPLIVAFILGMLAMLAIILGITIFGWVMGHEQ